MLRTTLAVALAWVIASPATAQDTPSPSADDHAAAEAEMRAIESELAASPTLVSLDIEDATAQQAIAAMAAQTGYSIELYDAPFAQQINLPRITLRVQDMPFWEAMFEMMRLGELSIYFTEDRILRLAHQEIVDQNLINLPRRHFGAFVVLPNQIQRISSVHVANPTAVNHQLRMYFRVYVEPKLHVLRSETPPNIEEVLDDKGNSLILERRGHGTSSTPLLDWNMNVTLRYPQNPGKTIKTIRGSFTVIVQTSSGKLEVPEILTATNVTQQVGDLTFTIQGAAPTADGRYAVRMLINRGDSIDEETFRRLMRRHMEMRMLDARGNVYHYNNSDRTQDGRRTEIEVRFKNFDDPAMVGEPATLVWEIPTGSQEITVPFTFNDLPLP